MLMNIKNDEFAMKMLLLIGAVLVIFALTWIMAFGLIKDMLVEVVDEVEPPESVVIDLGDTLWGIAKRFYPSAHTGKVVEAIRELNPDVDPGSLKIGQIVKLPKEVK